VRTLRYCPHCSGYLVHKGALAKCEFGCGKVWDSDGNLWDPDAREREAQAAREAERLRQQAAREAEHLRQQQECRRGIDTVAEQSIAVFESLPSHLDAAENWLDDAEVDFAEGAFSPFWDSIENAARSLARFDEGIRHIKANSSRYTELIEKYDGRPPSFPVTRESVGRFDVGKVTANRMKAIVRSAQRNFQFAVIYEQRKTSQILVAGFTNLAQALEQMTWQITDSVDRLASSIDTMTSTLDASLLAINSRVGDAIQDASEQHRELLDHLKEEASDRTTRGRRVLEMLDNIQRRRRPFP